MPWCVLPGGHDAACVGRRDLWPSREAMVTAMRALLTRVKAIEAEGAKPDVERALIVQAVRETVARLEGT